MAQFCTQCGSALEDGVQFCTQCGSPVMGSPVAAAPQGSHSAPGYPNPQQLTQPAAVQGWPQAAPIPVHKTSHNWLMIALIILLVLQIVLVALFGWPGFAVPNR